MSNNDIILGSERKKPDWVTIREAVGIANRLINVKITDSDIYRNALFGNICLSIYFQSSVLLRKVKITDHKVKLRPVENSFIRRFCLLEKKCFLCGRDFMLSTEGKYINPMQRIIDTALNCHEYVLIQRLLARSLRIPLPVTGANEINYGITVSLAGQTFQIFEKTTLQERIKQQIRSFPEHIAPDIYRKISIQGMSGYTQINYFPVHDLPKDACFVIRHAELEKLINMSIKNRIPPSSSTRISTPLSRLFWLACKHNETINPLIQQPYKLLSIFEQWALDEGITDRLSGDTLKTALERGSPTSVTTSN